MSGNVAKDAAETAKAGADKDLTGRAANEARLQEQGSGDKLREGVQGRGLDAVADAADRAANPPLTR